MTTSPEQSKIQAPTTDEAIPAWQVEYMCARLRTNLYERVLITFDDQAKLGKINRARLAKRLNKRPEQITRWLSGPNNLTVDTAAMLLLGMGAELDPQVVRIGAQHISYSDPFAAEIEPSVRPPRLFETRIDRASAGSAERMYSWTNASAANDDLPLEIAL